MKSAIDEVGFVGDAEKKFFQDILDDYIGIRKFDYDNLSNGYVYANARGSCACWWIYVVVLFHLGCSHYIIFIFNSLFGDVYFTLYYLLFGSQVALIIRIWWVALWAGFDGSMLHYGNRGCIEVLLPRGRITRWFTSVILHQAFPTLHLYFHSKPSKVGGKDITGIRIHRKADVGKMARMILWALKFDGTKWGMQPQNIHLFIPQRKLDALEKMKDFWNGDDAVEAMSEGNELVQDEFQAEMEDEEQERNAIALEVENDEDAIVEEGLEDELEEELTEQAAILYDKNDDAKEEDHPMEGVTPTTKNMKEDTASNDERPVRIVSASKLNVKSKSNVKSKGQARSVSASKSNVSQT